MNLASKALVLVLLIVISSTASAATLSAKPIAAFSASPVSGEVPLKVKFTDKSTGSPTSWKWNFGDGTYSTIKNPVHTYTKVKKYTVTLTVKNKIGSNSITKSNYITVTTLSSTKLKITSPKNGALVHIKETVAGTATNIPNGNKIWILVYPYQAHRYYPQSGKLILQNGKWSTPVYIGVTNNVGDKFDIIAVLANKQASDKFAAYIKHGIDTNDWPGMVGIPSGAKVYSKITVTRV